jgi:hypothetical protein
MAGTVVIAGNNLAALVAAESLAEAGTEVTIVNPAPAWGAHFAGLELGGRRFDPGMVLFEFSAFNGESSPDILSYDPHKRNDCGRFAGLVRNYVDARVPTVQAPGPAMLLDGRMLPDMVIANHVQALAMLGGQTRERVRSELATICAGGPGRLHASRKALDPQFTDIDFATVSLANHGRTLHNILFEPLCQKILGVGCGDILAPFHRAAWLPLFYPETLLSQFGATPQTLPPTAFHYPSEGSASALARILGARVEANARIRILRSAVRAFCSSVLELADGSTILAPELAWAMDPGTLIAAAEPDFPRAIYARASIGLCFVAVPREQVSLSISALFVADPARAIYRVTDQEVCAGMATGEHRLVVEFNPGILASRGFVEPAGQQQAILHELAELGVIATPQSVAYCAIKILNNALMIPNSANRDMFRQQMDWLHCHLPAVKLAGPSAGFHAGAMNDQIVQGLKLGAELRGRQ